MLMTDSPATAPAELTPRTRRCGWCRASGLHLDTRGGLERHRTSYGGWCRGFETFLTEETRGY